MTFQNILGLHQRAKDPESLDDIDWEGARLAWHKHWDLGGVNLIVLGGDDQNLKSSIRFL